MSILPFHTLWPKPWCQWGLGHYYFQELKLSRQRQRDVYFLLTGQKCIFSVCPIEHFVRCVQAQGYIYRQCCKKLSKWLVSVVYTFFCVTMMPFVLEQMKFEQNNHSVYSCSFYCSLPSVILCAPNREGRETYTQDVLSCLQHTLGLLEVAALFHKVHRFPHLMQNPTGETCWPCF